MSENIGSKSYRILLVVGYGYFYESFFRPIATFLSREHEVHVWFLGSRRLLRAESISLAEKDVSDGKIAGSRVFMPKNALQSKRSNMRKFRSRYSEILSLHTRHPQLFDHAFVINSSDLTTLPVLEAMHRNGTKITVVRPNTSESRFRSLIERSDSFKCPLLSKAARFRLVFFWEVASAALALLASKAKWPSLQKSVSEATGQSSQNQVTRFALPTRGLFGYFFSSLFRGLSDWYESNALFLNSRITTCVMVPNTGQAKLLASITPGPEYLPYGPPNLKIAPKVTESVGVFFPPGYSDKKEFEYFINEVNQFLSYSKIEIVTVRLHPHHSGGSDLQQLAKKVENCQIYETDLLTFIERHSIFIVYSNSSSLPVTLKLLKPTSKVILIPKSSAKEAETKPWDSMDGWMDSFFDSGTEYKFPRKHLSYQVETLEALVTRWVNQ